jgi:hypothetical protein
MSDDRKLCFAFLTEKLFGEEQYMLNTRGSLKLFLTCYTSLFEVTLSSPCIASSFSLGVVVSKIHGASTLTTDRRLVRRQQKVEKVTMQCVKSSES